ncbi:MAG TPA: PhzF family phenazine biosynthesis protein [Gammaproteobacteria bacterium]|nr:PhzF family phenazine biosynthesis protein [Gammaproteobacteria bacterium]
MKLSIYQVDAFTNAVFGGNPAAVVPLESWLDDNLLQKIAAENNVSETAFFVTQNDGYAIRWFTPVREVDLCGHATLATAFVISCLFDNEASVLQFDSASGELLVRLNDDKLELDFPSRPAISVDAVLAEKIAAALGCKPLWCGSTHNSNPESDKVLAVLNTDAAVQAVIPDGQLLKQLPGQGLIVSAEGKKCDFVSRYFAPKAGVDEDPATGSAHCTLVPYWSAKLGKKALFAHQLSKRGGELWCRLIDDRVRIAGQAVLYLKGEVTI